MSTVAIVPHVCIIINDQSPAYDAGEKQSMEEKPFMPQNNATVKELAVLINKLQV